MKVWGAGLLKGMSITLRNMRRGPITVQYPHETLELPERARWSVAPTCDEDGQIKCTACLSCIRACPDFVLEMDISVDEDKNKHINYFRYEVGACMMCGLCVEACPFDALFQTHDYELSKVEADALAVDLLTDIDAAKPKRAAARKPPAKADAARATAPAPEAAAGTDPEPSDDAGARGEGADD